MQRYSNMFIKILVLFRPFYNYSNLDPSLPYKKITVNSPMVQENLFRLKTLCKLSFFSTVYGLVLIYVYMYTFGAIYFIDFKVTATHPHLRKH